ncbi:hypothetical protein, partial [Desulfosarcina cetonica]|uniref:hypothetical protein n=1 Tax=Desulfosarcina cetonica TaxID=90730 RepID=UPI0006CF855B
MAGRAVTRYTHDIAVQIGAAHPDDVPIQRMLAQFYLSERRCDFVALNTYRTAMRANEAPPVELIHGVADLFLANQRVDNLALRVYLESYQHGSRDSRILPGLTACCRLIHPTPLTLPDLESAETILAGIDSARRRAMAVDFMPDMIADHAARSPRRHRRYLADLGTGVKSALGAMR